MFFSGFHNDKECADPVRAGLLPFIALTCVTCQDVCIVMNL